MGVQRNASIKPEHLPGLVHRTLAGLDQGIYTLEVWMQTLAPQACTPLQRHACEAVIVVLSGQGQCHLDGKVKTFGPDWTVVVGANVLYQLSNTSAVPMQLLVSMGMTPVQTETADGQPLVPPWRVHAMPD